MIPYIKIVYQLLSYSKSVYDLYYWLTKKELDDSYNDYILVDDN